LCVFIYRETTVEKTLVDLRRAFRVHTSAARGFLVLPTSRRATFFRANSRQSQNAPQEVVPADAEIAAMRRARRLRLAGALPNHTFEGDIQPTLQALILRAEQRQRQCGYSNSFSISEALTSSVQSDASVAFVADDSFAQYNYA
jgi:hypothetical protein